MITCWMQWLWKNGNWVCACACVCIQAYLMNRLIHHFSPFYDDKISLDLTFDVFLVDVIKRCFSSRSIFLQVYCKLFFCQYHLFLHLTTCWLIGLHSMHTLFSQILFLHTLSIRLLRTLDLVYSFLLSLLFVLHF